MTHSTLDYNSSSAGATFTRLVRPSSYSASSYTKSSITTKVMTYYDSEGDPVYPEVLVKYTASSYTASSYTKESVDYGHYTKSSVSVSSSYPSGGADYLILDSNSSYTKESTNYLTYTKEVLKTATGNFLMAST